LPAATFNTQNGIPSGNHSPVDSHTLLAGPKSSNPLSQVYVAIAPMVNVSLENDTVECAGAPGNLQRASVEIAQHLTNPVIVKMTTRRKDRRILQQREEEHPCRINCVNCTLQCSYDTIGRDKIKTIDEINNNYYLLIN